MKKLKFLLLVGFVSQLQNRAVAQLVSFSYTNVTGSNSITCNVPFIHLVFSSSYTAGPVTYYINSASFSTSGTATSYSLNSPGTYTLSAQASGSMSAIQVVSIGTNTTPPTSSITPIFQLITCTNNAVQTVSATAHTPTTNVTHTFNWSMGGSIIAYQATAVVTPPPGTHTYVLTNLINGCSTSKTFTVATGSGFPTYTVLSPIQNFSVGCVPKHVCDLTILNPNTNPPGGSMSFTLLSSNSSTNYGFNSAASYSITTPGIYTIVTRDDVTNCQTKVSVSITQNTFAPQRSVAMVTQTLTCFTPSVVLTGSSQTPNSSYQWSTTTGVIVGNTVLVNTTANQSTTLINTYQFIVTDNNNACRSYSFVPIYQNIFIPKALIVPQSGGTVAISCLMPSVTLVNQSSTGIPPNTFPIGGFVIGRLWEGPSPQVPKVNSSNYVAFIPGTYSLTVEDMNNGCKSSTVFVVGDNRVYPEIDTVQNWPFIPCDGSSTTVTLSANLISSTAPCRYEWFGSLGLLRTATLSTFPSVATATVPSADIYTLVVTNLSNGCVSILTVPIYACVGMDEDNNHAAKITIYPNPAGELLYLDLPKNHREISVKIYNAQGALIIEQTLGQAENAVRLEKIAKGLYSIQVLENTRLLYHSRLIKD